MRGRRPDFRLLVRGLFLCGALAVAAQGLFAATDLSAKGSGATLSEGVYYLNASKSFAGGVGQAGLSVADGATVAIYLPEDVTLTVRGASASGATAGTPGISLPASSTLILVGKGRVAAFGGDAAQGSDAAAPGIWSDDAHQDWTRYLDGAYTGVWNNGHTSHRTLKSYGGRGGVGGGGAGAGIGGAGGAGGTGGDCAVLMAEFSSYNAGLSGSSGFSGGAGGTGETMGSLYVLDAIVIKAEGGSFALGGEGADESPKDSSRVGVSQYYMFGGSSGGGGGGGGGGAATEIGGGGAGGGGGGAGGGGTLVWCYGDDQKYGDGGGGSGGSAGKGAYGDDGGDGMDGTGTRSVTSVYKNDSCWGGAGASGGSGGAAGGDGKIYLSERADVPYGNPEPDFVETHAFLKRTILIDFAGGESQGAASTTVSAYLYLTMPEVPIPDRVGYIFRGYFTGANGTGQQVYTDTGDSLDTIWRYDGSNLRLYANWEKLDPPPDPLVVTRLDDAAFDPYASNITFRAAVTWAMMIPTLTAPDGTKSKVVFADSLLAGKASVEVGLTAGVIRVGANRFTDHPLVLRGPGLTTCNIVISGAKNGDRILDVGAGNAVELEGYTLRGGTSAEDGGALWMRGGTLKARGCNFLGNAAYGSGGAIHAGETEFVRLENCRFDGNATSAKSGGGGAVCGGRTLVVDNCSFWANSGAYGGAIRSGASTLVVNSSFFKNAAWQTGGGVYSGGASDHVTVVNCTFEANIANGHENADANFDGGGGLYVQGGGRTRLDLVNSFFVGNRRSTLACPDVQFGARVATLNVYASLFGVAHTQIVARLDRNVRLGKAERAFFEVGERDMAYRQTVKDGVVHDYLRTVDTDGDVGYAVYRDADWANVALASAWGGAKSAIRGDAARATALLLNDISTRDLGLSCRNSQCGSYWYVHDRPEDGTVVTKIEDASDAYDGALTLREIVCGIADREDLWRVNRTGGVYTVTFDERLRGQTFRLAEAGHLDIHGATNGVNIVVDGGDRNITIDGDGRHRAFVVRPGSSLTLKNLTFVNCVGMAEGATFVTGYDGGAVANFGALAVSNCTFRTCAGGPSFAQPVGFGGAICNGSGAARATLDAIDTTFADCRAARGGAVYNADGSDAAFVGCTFTGNRAGSVNSVFVALGGAIGAGKDSTLAYSQCRFDDNTIVIDGCDIPEDVRSVSDAIHTIRYANGTVAVSLNALALPDAGSLVLDATTAATLPDGTPAVTMRPTGVRPGLWYGLGHTPDLALPFTVDAATWVQAGADGTLPEPLRAPKSPEKGFYKVFVRE